MKNAIIITCFVLTLAIIGLVTAGSICTVDTSLNLKTPDAIQLTVSSQKMNADEGDTFNKQKVLDLLFKSSEQKYLAALFQKTKDNTPTITAASKTLSVTSLYTLVFVYNETQTLNVSDYKKTNDFAATEIAYTTIYVQVSDVEGFAYLNFYILNENSTTKSGYYISQYCDQSKIYDYLTEKFAS